MEKFVEEEKLVEEEGLGENERLHAQLLVEYNDAAGTDIRLSDLDEIAYGDLSKVSFERKIVIGHHIEGYTEFALGRVKEVLSAVFSSHSLASSWKLWFLAHGNSNGGTVSMRGSYEDAHRVVNAHLDSVGAPKYAYQLVEAFVALDEGTTFGDDEGKNSDYFFNCLMNFIQTNMWGRRTVPYNGAHYQVYTSIGLPLLAKVNERMKKYWEVVNRTRRIEGDLCDRSV